MPHTKHCSSCFCVGCIRTWTKHKARLTLKFSWEAHQKWSSNLTSFNSWRRCFSPVCNKQLSIHQKKNSHVLLAHSGVGCVQRLTGTIQLALSFKSRVCVREWIPGSFANFPDIPSKTSLCPETFFTHLDIEWDSWPLTLWTWCLLDSVYTGTVPPHFGRSRPDRECNGRPPHRSVYLHRMALQHKNVRIWALSLSDRSISNNKQLCGRNVTIRGSLYGSYFAPSQFW